MDIKHTVSPKQALEFIKNGALLIDLRNPDFLNGREFDVPEILYIFHSKLEELYHEIPNDRTVILADNVGIQSNKAVDFLISKGYRNVFSLTGGVIDWEKDKLPLKLDKGNEMVGGCACKLTPRKFIKE